MFEIESPEIVPAAHNRCCWIR